MFARLRREPGFYKRLWTLALPLIAQNLITTSLGFVDTFMVGLLGNNPLSAVTAANVPIFLIQVIIFGLMSGLTVLVSQYWGKGDTQSINRCMGVAMYAGATLAAVMAVVLFFFPHGVMNIVTDNPILIELGAPYLRIVGISYIFNAVSSVYVGMQRSTENSRFGMLVFGASMLLNTLLNYCLIFGHFGAPALGITGAAIATLTSRIAEFAIVLVYALANRRIPLQPKALFHPGVAIAKSALHYSGPVILNETLWGLGTSVMTAIMGHMAISADMLAAYAIMGNIDKFSTVTCFGLAGATAVVVGKRIGEGATKEQVYDLGSCLLTLSAMVGILIALGLALLLPTVFIPYLYPLFSLSEQATRIAIIMCIVYLCVMPMRAFDITNITGLLRAGGDARMAAVLDLSPLWVAAIPLTALCALVLDAPIVLVCIATQAENFFKMPLGVIRLRSRKWINDVTVRKEEL
ncbi:MAG: MATE family efflux transporter [Oscillibacter sp.]|jgi:putative MATE family efflux protein|nr:MATE family efflux transporter [Oscillibacter sp.]